MLKNRSFTQIFVITLGTIAILISTQLIEVVHALSTKLPVGSWTITVGKVSDIATKSTLNIISVSPGGSVTGNYQGQPITGTYSSSSQGNRLDWHKTNIETNIKYTGYLIIEPGCNQNPGNECKYTLAGYKTVPGGTSGQFALLGNTNGWYAQITVILPPSPPK